MIATHRCWMSAILAVVIIIWNTQTPGWSAPLQNNEVYFGLPLLNALQQVDSALFRSNDCRALRLESDEKEDLLSRPLFGKQTQFGLLSDKGFGEEIEKDEEATSLRNKRMATKEPLTREERKQRREERMKSNEEEEQRRMQRREEWRKEREEERKRKSQERRHRGPGKESKKEGKNDSDEKDLSKKLIKTVSPKLTTTSVPAVDTFDAAFSTAIAAPTTTADDAPTTIADDTPTTIADDTPTDT